MLLSSSTKKRDEDRSTLSVLRRFDKNSKDIDLRVQLTISYLLELSRQVTEIQKIVESERQILEDETDALEAAAKAKGINKEDVISEIRRLLEESDLTDIQSDIDTTITCLNVCQGCLGREETNCNESTECNQSGCGVVVGGCSQNTECYESTEPEEPICSDPCEVYLAPPKCNTICEYSLSCGTGECLQCDGTSEKTTHVVCTQCNTDNCTTCDTDNCTGLACDGQIDVKCTLSEEDCDATFDDFESVSCDEKQKTCGISLSFECWNLGIDKADCGKNENSEYQNPDCKVKFIGWTLNCGAEAVDYGGCLFGSNDQTERCYGVLSIDTCEKDELLLDGCSATGNTTIHTDAGTGDTFYCNPAISVCNAKDVGTTIVNKCGTAGVSTTETVNGEEFDCVGGVAIQCGSAGVSAVCENTISCNGVSQDTYNTIDCGTTQKSEHTESSKETIVVCDRCDGNTEQVTATSSEEIDNWLNECEIGLSNGIDACGVPFGSCLNFAKCSGPDFGTAVGCGTGEGCGNCEATTQCGTCEATTQCDSCQGNCQGGCQATAQCGNCVSTCQSNAEQCPSCYGTCDSSQCTRCDNGESCCQYVYRCDNVQCAMCVLTCVDVSNS